MNEDEPPPVDEREALVDVIAERLAQDKKWGEQNHPNLYWLGILMEEIGELSKDIVEGRDCRSELVQATAVALAWIECIDRNNGAASD